MAELDGILADAMELEREQSEKERKELDTVRQMLSNNKQQR